MKLYRTGLALAAFFLLFSGACAKNPAVTNPPPQTVPPLSGNGTPNQGTPGKYVEILIPGRNFVPDTIDVTVGTTVNWVSRDGEVHTVTSDIPGLFNGTVEAFGSFAYTFNQTGDFEYFCSIHGQMGMRGAVHVN
jgi:plastocyanin